MPVRFPILNPYQFAEVGKTQPARYLTRYPSSGWLYKETLLNYQYQKTDYYQKARFDDVICIQFKTDYPAGAVVSVYKGTTSGTGTLIDSLAIGDATQAALSGETIDGDPVTTVQFTFILNQLAGFNDEEDLYYFVVFNGIGSTTTHLSEPIYFRAQHINTCLIEYGNSINDFDTVFEQLSPRFQKRISGAVHSYEGGSNDVVYNNQNEEPVLLDSIPYDTYLFTAAGDIGIPTYELQKLNHIFSCDSIAIDNKTFVKNDGATFEYQTERNYPLQGATIKLKAAENIHSLTTTTQRTTVTSGTPPYAAYAIGLFNGVNYVELYTAGTSIIIEDNTDGAAKATALNALSAGMGLAGTFGWTNTGGILYYDNADGENWFVSTAVIQNGLVNLVWTTSDVTKTATFSLYAYPVTIDYDDSTIALIPDTGGGFSSVAHEYATAGTYTQRLFYNEDDGIIKLTIQQPPTDVNLDNITGSLGGDFTHLHVFDTTLSGSFNLNFLNNCRNSIVSIVVLQCGMVAPFTGTFLTGGGLNILPALTFMDFRANALSTNGLGDFLTEYKDYVKWTSTPIKYVRLEGAGNATPNVAGLTAKNIINISWSFVVPSGVITSN